MGKRRYLAEAGMEAFERENSARGALGMKLTTENDDDHDCEDGYLADDKGRDRGGGRCSTSSGNGGVTVDGVGRLAVLKRSVESKVSNRIKNDGEEPAPIWPAKYTSCAQVTLVVEGRGYRGLFWSSGKCMVGI